MSDLDQQCSYCNNSSVIQRKHSGDYLCPKCFEKSIEKIIYKTISKYKMLRPQDKVIVALSGGKDSITLLYNLMKIQERTYRSETLIALTIDEGIKDYSQNNIKLAKRFCKKYNINHEIISFKEKLGKTLDEIIHFKNQSGDYKYACNYCATIKRRLLNEGASELGGTIVAKGHNLTDMAETFLMNILYKRFHLISNQFFFKPEKKQILVKKITPLMRIPEDEILLYVNMKKFDYYSTICPYREKDPIIRKRLLDFIEECKTYSPEIEFNLFKGFLELSRILYKLHNNKSYNSCKTCGYPSGNKKTCSYCDLVKEFTNKT